METKFVIKKADPFPPIIKFPCIMAHTSSDTDTVRVVLFVNEFEGYRVDCVTWMAHPKKERWLSVYEECWTPVKNVVYEV